MTQRRGGRLRALTYRAHRRQLARLICGLALAALASAPATAGAEVHLQLRAAAAAACAPKQDQDTSIAAALGGAVRLDVAPMEIRGRAVGARTRFLLKDGARVFVERFAPDGVLRRVVIVYHAPPARSRRPEWMVFANGDCRVLAGRRLIYDGPGAAVYLEATDATLERVEVREPLNPPVPDGRSSAGVLVALVDSGVNYLLDPVQRYIARSPDGKLLGFDFWDMDARPFDSNPARSPFLPQRHGTQTAGVLITEAPMSRLVVYRYPRPDMSRMKALIEDAASNGVVIVNLSLGSADAEEWLVFEETARAHPGILFIASAGNNGRNIDEQPVYPAGLPLENLLTATSSLASGVPARGSNWGAASVDLMVPAENLVSIDFHGRPTLVSGSSYAAARISALAACLLAQHPDWKAPQLKAAIVAMVQPSVNRVVRVVSKGFIKSPTLIDRGACGAEPDGVELLSRVRIGADKLYADATVPESVDLALDLSLVILEGTSWSSQLLESVARDAAGVFTQCNIGIRGVELIKIRVPRRYLYFNDVHANELISGIDIPRPAVFFVRDTLKRVAFDAEAIGHANGRGRPALVDTVWMTEAVGHSGLALAHELYHVLADSGRHSTDPTNLMYPETLGENVRLNESQCGRMRMVGVAFGHLTPAR